MIAHCLFEQSGTFKNEFKKLGIEAYDYDILNDYGETDYQLDLFAEIRGGYEGKPSIFDRMSPEDLVLAFFPCTRFENQVMLWFRGQNQSEKNWSLKQKLEYNINLQWELSHNYELISKLVIIAINKGLRLVIENPFSEEHYLRRYWCVTPAIIDKDRRANGDKFKKPTQYFFIGFEPKQNILFEPITYVECQKDIAHQNTWKERSEIHPQYASRFIRQYLIDYETDIERLFNG